MRQVDESPPQALEERARAGDAAAFGALIRLYDSDLRGVVWNVVRNGHATDDVMQAAYEKAFRSVRQFDRRSSMKTWLHSICYRSAIDHVRYEAHRRHETLDPLINVAGPDNVPGSALARLEVDSALASLDPDQRAMLMLTAVLGYSFDETAQIVGRRRGTVASKVGRARRELRRWSPS